MAPPSANGGNADGGLLHLEPLPPLDPVFLAHLPPVSLSPRHALAFISQTVGGAGRPAQPRFLICPAAAMGSWRWRPQGSCGASTPPCTRRARRSASARA